MKKRKSVINNIEDELFSFYSSEIENVEVPPVPEFSDYRKTIVNDTKSFRFIFPRVAAALLLIAFGSFFFVRPVTANPLAETIAYLTEEYELDEKITSGLQRAGHFLSNTLEKNK